MLRGTSWICAGAASAGRLASCVVAAGSCGAVGPLLLRRAAVSFTVHQKYSQASQFGGRAEYEARHVEQVFLRRVNLLRCFCRGHAMSPTSSSIGASAGHRARMSFHPIAIDQAAAEARLLQRIIDAREPIRPCEQRVFTDQNQRGSGAGRDVPVPVLAGGMNTS